MTGVRQSDSEAGAGVRLQDVRGCVTKACWLLLSDGLRPTEDIYFLRSVAPLLRARRQEVRRLDVRGWRWALVWPQLAQQRGANLVLCRTLPPRVLWWLERERARFGRIIYLIDDDLPAAAEDERLPEPYRRRMARAAARQPRLLALADTVVAASPLLADRLAERHPRLHVMSPSLIAPLCDLSHFAAGPSATAPWRIGFHGSRAHLADLEHIAPALVALQQRREDSQLELMLGERTPPLLAALPRVSCPAPLPWDDFQAYRARRRLHIGLVPMLDTAFNRSKSTIKFLDIAVMGGVGIYSRGSPYGEMIREGVDGLLAEDDPADWHRCLEWLLQQPAAARAMAEAAAERARRQVLAELPAWVAEGERQLDPQPARQRPSPSAPKAAKAVDFSG